jgi:hypothetical protein
MKTLLIFSMCMMLFGCGKLDGAETNPTGYTKVCIDGVKYFKFATGVSVVFSADGKIENCAN